MVHKKYIIRNGKKFGPYLYENYREKGITKTRYLGIAKEDKKLRVNLFLIAGIILLIIFLIGFAGLFITADKDEFFGELSSGSPLNAFKQLFVTGSPLNVFVQIISVNPPKIIIPEIDLYVCENTKANFLFIVTDEDGVTDVSVSIDPPNPFYVKSSIFNENTLDSIIWSDTLSKQKVINKRDGNNGWAIYPETINAVDSTQGSDYKRINILVLEINRAPNFNIPLKTILPNDKLYVSGDESIFYYNLGEELRDKDNPEETPTNNLIFNLTYLDGSKSPFNISKLGIINISGNKSLIPAGQESIVYHLKVLVNDTGIKNPHSKVVDRFCLPDDYLPLSYSDSFDLIITNENRAPNITSHFPVNLSLSVFGTELLYFNITSYDADWDFVNTYWYVDGVFKGYYESVNSSEFKYNFDCETSENHTIKVEITDGLLNNSIEWNLSVKYEACPVPVQESSSGGGGSSGRIYCRENWGCNEWLQCQNLNELVESGWTKEETKLLLKERCDLLNYSSEYCGFQQRFCIDYNKCKTEFEKPGDLRECYYTENPTCEDGIKNCHNDSCEVLTDCGGPCSDCPTCSDKIQNQNEEKIDCGGVCEPCIEYAWVPTLFNSLIISALIGSLVIVLFLIIQQILKYKEVKKIFNEMNLKKNVRKIVEKNTGEKNVVVSLFFVFIILGLLFVSNFYIIGVAQQGKIPSPGDIGFLASYGLINNLFGNFGMFFVSGPITSWDIRTKLIIRGDSDNKYSGQDIYFYAIYNYNSGEPVVIGSCRIRFGSDSGYSGWENMIYDGISKFTYNLAFSYKGEYNFQVECSENGEFVADSSPGFVAVSDKFKITNTPPFFKQNTYQITYHGFEDNLFSYNFSSNVTDFDSNDKLSFDFQSINLESISNYPWISLNSSTGIMIINSTKDIEAQNFRVSVKVLDSDNVGELREFYFNIVPRNDPPVFYVENQSIPANDEFVYTFIVDDEEDNQPFLFNVNFMSCSDELMGNCNLFNPVFDVSINGNEITIRFTPSLLDVGNYIMDFSVEDTNSLLGNAMSSQLVNYTIQIPIWETGLDLDYGFAEGDIINLNLNDKVVQDGGVVSFSFKTLDDENEEADNLPSFALDNGIISFIPDDADVGYWEVEINAQNLQTSSTKLFKFTINNTNDSVFYPPSPIQPGNYKSFNGNNLEVYENKNINIYLQAGDNDLLIPQKSFYNESLKINLSVERQGTPNLDLFNFIFQEIISSNNLKNLESHLAEFKPREKDIGNYLIKINTTDANNYSSNYLEFNLIIINQDYDTPNITSPIEGYEFNFIEGQNYSLIFNVNHTIGDDLDYYFYIGDKLREVKTGPGDNSNFIWKFNTTFRDETYGNKTNLTLLVVNPYDNDFNISRIWNLTINHSNSPVEFIDNIDDMEFDYGVLRQIDLKYHFFDIDNVDEHYLQNLSFNITSNSSPSYITISEVLDDWTFRLSSSKSSVFNETLIVSAYDLNMTNESIVLTNISSNYFIVNIVAPKTEIVNVPQPTSGGGGGGGGNSQIVSLKIISPGEISVYNDEKIIIPIQLINTGKSAFNDLSLNVSAFKQGNFTNKIKTSLDKNYFKSLKPNQQENLTLEVFFDKEGAGAYEILIEAKSKNPNYKDSEKIYLNPINDSNIKELLIFTEELLAENPACIELTEVLNEAEKSYVQGDYLNAKIKSQEAISACKSSIESVSIPRRNFRDYSLLFYFALGILFAVILGMIYYLYKKEKFAKPEPPEQQSFNKPKDIINQKEGI